MDTEMLVETLEVQCIQTLIRNGGMLRSDETSVHYSIGHQDNTYHTGVHYDFFSVQGTKALRRPWVRLFSYRFEHLNIREQPPSVVLASAKAVTFARDLTAKGRCFSGARVLEGFFKGDGFSLAGDFPNPKDSIFLLQTVGFSFSWTRAAIAAVQDECLVSGFGVLIDRTIDEKQRPHLFAPAFRYVAVLDRPDPVYIATKDDCPHCKRGVKVHPE